VKSDEELMAAYGAGDAAAFRELFARYSTLLYRMMLRDLRRPEEARDLVQQTFLHLHRARNDFDGRLRFRPWVFTIALNLKREHFRRVRRRPEASLDAEGAVEPQQADHGDRAAARQAIRHGLDRLPRDQREVIELHWFDGLSFAEVGEVVGASVAAVKVRAHRGYVALRRLLDDSQLPPLSSTVDSEE
jgi:RNA polymerase sigma-70 factor (ECF subfamily)